MLKNHSHVTYLLREKKLLVQEYTKIMAHKVIEILATRLHLQS